MAGISFRFELDDTEAQAALSRIEAGAVDATPLMGWIGLALETSAKERIGESNVAPSGIPWKQSRRAQEDGTPTLFATGQLQASITHQAGPDRAEVGSNKIYARIHQLGGEIRPVNAAKLVFPGADGGIVFADKVTIPARPYLGVSSEDGARIEELTIRWLGDLAGGSAGGPPL